MRVAVLGGGITGLACAYYARRAGLAPTVFEATQGAGVLSQRFASGDGELDCFHSGLSRRDLALCGLLAELGLLPRMVWREVATAVYLGGAVRAIQSTAFPPLGGLSRRERLRTQLASRICRGWFHAEADLQRRSGREWLVRYYGARVYERAWLPLLRLRFGENAEEIPASVVWRLLRELFVEQRDVQGHLLGGYAALCEKLRQSLADGGHPVRTATPVRGIQPEGAGVVVTTDAGIEPFAAAISTLAMPDLAKIAPAAVLSHLPRPALEQRGVVSVVALLRRSPGLPYRVVDLEGELGFEQVIAADQLLPAASFGRLHPVYLVQHCSVDGERYRAGDGELASAGRAALARLCPQLGDADVESVRVFRAPHVDPVWRVGCAQRQMPLRVERSSLYLCSAAQAYPREAGSETSIVLARESVRRLLRDLPAS
jgi:protoporphyrinogen oxidase